MFSQLEYIYNIEKYKKIIDDINNNKLICVNNASSNIQKLLALLLFKKTKENIILVYPNIYEATIAYEDMLELVDDDSIGFYPTEELVASELVASSDNYRLDRIKTVFKAINKIPQIVITTTEGLTRNIMNKSKIQDSLLELSTSIVYNRDLLISNLNIRGYKRKSLVETKGTFSVRGSIVDIFPINYEMPIRIDFFDDEIESIKVFDVKTQRSVSNLEQVSIFPYYEIIYMDDEVPGIIDRIKEDQINNVRIDNIISQIINRENIDQLYLFLPYIDSDYETFVDLFETKSIIFSNIQKIIEKETLNYNELFEYASSIDFKLNNEFLKNTLQFIGSANKTLFFESFNSKNAIIEPDLNIDLETSDNVEYSNYLGEMIEEFKLVPNKTYIVSHYDEQKLKLIEELLINNNIEYVKQNRIIKNKINLVVSESALGFIDYQLGIEIITPKQFAKNKIYRKTKFFKEMNQSIQIYSKDELSVGDYVVHKDYGIGIYKGIKIIENKTLKNDYLMIEYADNGKLYVPVEKIYILQKYLGSFDTVPKLTKLNTKEWEKKKNKVKEKLVVIAKELIETQVKREQLKGYIYNKDSEEQLKFESDFDFIETPDQIKAIEDVKKDMESNKSLDRLICGDVGFGKTEVAMRAAFKAVDNGKQVLVLAPTTVLTRQHYYNFKDRFEKYGVRVELLNRFVDQKTVKVVLEGLTAGYVDIVIGTHRLLSEDVKPKNLGLLIIDEEQRFGVLHKERIKKMKANVDVLSLSATPIPRTLQMSLSGLKEMSLIETPPVNRKSVQTYVLKTNESVIREAIYREMARGGQTFYLLNKISKLDLIKSKIKRLVPKAHAAIIHGKMDKEDIENVLNDFLDKKYDVLICTTIIETGIDIPNANTLIIEEADHLGLAQLYQIRGRVGRSKQIAYAYLMYNSDLSLTDVASKRLNAIKEFTSLGSGYKVAMRDLSIRGAGDILGSEQSGFINEIGVELYLQMLEETIAKEKGKAQIIEENKSFDMNISKTVDSHYVEDDSIKIYMHQAISKVFSKEQADTLINEFSDRFGNVPKELETYIYGKYLETLLKQKGVEKYKVTDKCVELNFDSEHTQNLRYIYFLKVAKEIAPNWIYEYKNQRIYISIPISPNNNLNSSNSYIYQLMEFMENI